MSSKITKSILFMKYLKDLLFLLIPLGVLGQSKQGSLLAVHPIDQHICKSSFAKIKLNAVENTIERLQDYLQSHIDNLQMEGMGLKILTDIESPAARHITFQQTYMDIPIYSATIKANLNKQGDIISLFDNSYEISQSLSDNFASQQIIDAHLLTFFATANVKWERSYFYTGEEMLPSIKFTVYESASHYYDEFINTKGEVMYQRDLLKYNKPATSTSVAVDSVVSANVFLPDPLTSAAVTYGNPYYDNNDADASVLTSQLVNVDITVKYALGVFSLSGTYAIIKDIESPSVAPVTSTSPNFSFTRSQSGFEDVNTYYYVNLQQSHLRNLGFTNLVNYAISIDAHAWSGQDQSSFVGMGSNSQLLFGEGGVDDAEDADVILHEYGHAILHSASPNATFGTEMNAIDEGDGDYFAASFSRSISSYNWEDVFSWDGHNEFWSGRVVETTKHYPDDLAGNLYTDAPLWSSTLMQIWADLGRDTTDQLLLQSMYSFSDGMSMTDAAKIYLQSDTLLYSAKHASTICNWMDARGFINCISGINDIQTNENNTVITLLNSAAFARGNENLRVSCSVISPIYVQLYTAEGKLVFADYKEGCKIYELPGLNLSQGIYILRINLPTSMACFKLAKY